MRMKSLLIIIGLILTIAALMLVVLAHPAFGTFRKLSQGCIENSPHYYDGMFQNQEPTPQFTGDVSPSKTFWKFLTTQNTLRVPSEPIPAIKTDLKTLPTDKDWLIWFGHSSYLFCLGGKRFLVDPVLKPEYPSSLMLKAFAGTDIYRPEDLPEIDVLVITHEHWDHMDYATIRDIRLKVREVICPLGIADYLRYWHYSDEQIHEMDWFDKEQLFLCPDSFSITCLPARHFSNRLLHRRNQTLWASFLIDDGIRKVYIGGDTGYGKHFAEIHKRFGDVDLAFLENGQYNDHWRYIHTMPEDLEKVILDLQPKQVFTVHHDKFALARHPWQEPDSVAQALANKLTIRLLDAPIGKPVFF